MTKYKKKLCEHLLKHANVGYCGKQDTICLVKKYGIKDMKKMIVQIPYKKTVVIYPCDGKLEKKVEGGKL